MGIDFNDIVYENVKWMFSGIGIVVLGFFIRKISLFNRIRRWLSWMKVKKHIKVNMKTGLYS